jgi:hypothetical protein
LSLYEIRHFSPLVCYVLSRRIKYNKIHYFPCVVKNLKLEFEYQSERSNECAAWKKSD